MKNKFIFVLGLFICFLFIPDAYALNTDKLSVTCIYADGTVFDYYDGYLTYNNNPSYNRMNTKQSSLMFSFARTDSFYYDGNVKCPNVMRTFEGKIGDDDTMPGIFSYFEGVPKMSMSESVTAFSDIYKIGIISYFQLGGLQMNAEFNGGTEVKLISEEISFDDENDYVTECEYIHKQSQAFGENKYLVLYSVPDNNQQFVDSNYAFTSVDQSVDLSSGCPQIIYVNEVGNYLDIKDSTISMKYDDVRHSILLNKDADHSVKYELLNKEEEEKIEEETVCNNMPNTFNILKEIALIARVIVPVFILVLTVFDFSKLILSFEMDEKSKLTGKRFAIRLILGLVFLLLPEIIVTILNLLYNSGIVGIDVVNCFKL